MEYDIGTEPTKEEWAVYKRVFEYDQRTNVAWFVKEHFPDFTQEQFERAYRNYVEAWKDDGEHDWMMLYEACDEAGRQA